MPSCAFRKCSNNTRNTSKTNGVTFHTFPQDPTCKEKWIKVIQEDQRDEEWLPTQYSRVCSAHFTENDFHLTPQGRRKIKVHAVPSFCPTQNLSQDSTSDVEEILPGSPLEINIHVSDSIYDTRKIHLRKKLSIETCKKKKCRREMLKLKKENKYLKSKISSLREIVKFLRGKNILLKKAQTSE